MEKIKKTRERGKKKEKKYKGKKMNKAHKDTLINQIGEEISEPLILLLFVV